MRYNPPRKNSNLTFRCLSCNKEGIFNPHKRRGKFCNAKCHSNYRFKYVVTPKVLAGLASRASVKRWLISERGYKCELCQISEWHGKALSLELDHIDGNSDDSKPSNIRLLCPNCHSQTETYGSRNTKNTKRNKYQRHWKAIRYKSAPLA